jgi:hypothetical protein
LFAAGGAFEDAFVTQIVIVIGEGPFRALPAQNVILLWSQNLFPFCICPVDLVGHSSWHLVRSFLCLTDAVANLIPVAPPLMTATLPSSNPDMMSLPGHKVRLR